MNKILIVLLSASVLCNLYFGIARYNLKTGFSDEVKANITRHCVAGRLDHIKSEFETAEKFYFDITPKNIGPDCLEQACHHGHAYIVEYLLENGQDANLIQDCTSVFRNNDVETIKLLIKYKKQFSEDDLASAAYWGSHEIVKLILASSEYSKAAYTNALFASLSFSPNIDIVKALLAKGADINSKNKSPIEDFDTDKSPTEMVKYRIKNKWRPVKAWEAILKYFENS